MKALNKAGLEASVRAYGSSGVVARWPSPYTVASDALLLASLFVSLLPWLALAAACGACVPARCSGRWAQRRAPARLRLGGGAVPCRRAAGAVAGAAVHACAVLSGGGCLG